MWPPRLRPILLALWPGVPQDTCAHPPLTVPVPQRALGAGGLAMHRGEHGAADDMGTWVLWWHCSMAAGPQADIPKEGRAISSAKQDAQRGLSQEPPGIQSCSSWWEKAGDNCLCCFLPQQQSRASVPKPCQLLTAAWSSHPLVVWTQSCLPSPVTPSRSLQKTAPCSAHPHVQ